MEDSGTPATRQDIERVLQTIHDMETRLKAEFSNRIEAVETKLLGAFFSYQEYDRIENRKFRADLSNVSAASDLRFDNLESRIATLERALLSKPDQPSS